jgi:Leucine-rich repeat (LRR) protein
MNGLKLLVLRDNEIKQLPSPLFDMEKLETLDLKNNQIGEIPDRIKNLKNLKYLGLKGNPIDNIEAIKKLLPGTVVDY